MRAIITAASLHGEARGLPRTERRRGRSASPRTGGPPPPTCVVRDPLRLGERFDVALHGDPRYVEWRGLPIEVGGPATAAVALGGLSSPGDEQVQAIGVAAILAADGRS